MSFLAAYMLGKNYHVCHIFNIRKAEHNRRKKKEYLHHVFFSRRIGECPIFPIDFSTCIKMHTKIIYVGRVGLHVVIFCQELKGFGMGVASKMFRV